MLRIMTKAATLTRRHTFDAFNHIAQANHCQAGAVVALSGALAAALAQATANGSLQDGATGEAQASGRQVQQITDQARARFQRLADRDAEAITTFVELRKRGEALKGYELLCNGPREMADLAVHTTHVMQSYRTQVGERTKDDLEFAITLMVGVARAATQLLDSNLRIWPLPALLAKYDAHVIRLTDEINQLRPAVRIR